jgi:hypothetical protein
MSALDKFDLRVPVSMRVAGERQAAWDTERILYTIVTEFERAVVALAIFDLRRFRRGNKYALILNNIAAREFVLSLDAITNLLEHLKPLSPPAAVRSLVASYRGTYGYLTHIRDSFIHIEQRGRGRDRKNKRLRGITFINCFTDRVWEFTGNDGKKYSVEISESTLLPVRDIVQKIIDSYFPMKSFP